MTIVKLADARKAGICKNQRQWFEKHDLDFREFVLRGLPAEDLIATGDQQDVIQEVIKNAEEREAIGRQK